MDPRRRHRRVQRSGHDAHPGPGCARPRARGNITPMWAVLRGDWAHRPERVALRHLDGSGSLTYRQLDEAVGRRADMLQRAGIGHGSRLGVAVGSPHEVVLAVLAGTA